MRYNEMNVAASAGVDVNALLEKEEYERVVDAFTPSRIAKIAGIHLHTARKRKEDPSQLTMNQLNKLREAYYSDYFMEAIAKLTEGLTVNDKQNFINDAIVWLHTRQASGQLEGESVRLEEYKQIT